MLFENARFFQIGYVARSLTAAVAAFHDRTGAKLMDITTDLRDHEGNEVLIKGLAHMQLSHAEVELIEPRQGWSSVYDGYLPVSDVDVSFHHMGFMMNSRSAWEKAINEAQYADLALPFEGRFPSVCFAYIDTRQAMGHFTELVWRASNL